MKKSGCVIIVLFLAICASMFVNLVLCAALVGDTTGSGLKVAKEKDFEEALVQEGSANSDGKIVVIPLTGVIAHGTAGALGDDMVEDFKNALDQAKKDSSVKAIVLSVDSPGGEITASDVLYHALKEFTAKSGKPSVVYFNSIGASGAYYTACGASYIMCNATTFTGSIGVIISTLNYRELFGKLGLQSVVFKSGKFKDMLNGAREMTPEEQAYIQGLVMQSYDKFVGIVAKARGLDEQTLRNGIADGRIMSGTDALEAKLVNQLGYIEDAYAKAKELGKAQDAKVVRYKRVASFEKFFRMFGESKVPAIKVDVLEGMPKLEQGRVYLLPPFYAQ